MKECPKTSIPGNRHEGGRYQLKGGELVEDLEEFSVGELDRTIRVGSQRDLAVKEELISFLQKIVTCLHGAMKICQVYRPR